jgi:predicted nuclease of predicted toxin-antitoxin system
MAYVLTYNDLVNQITNYCVRVGDTDFANEIPLFVRQAENKCARDIKSLIYKTYSAFNLVAGTPIYQKPALWRETVSLWFGNGTNNNTRNYLIPSGYEFCRAYWPDDTQTAPPIYYTDTTQNNILICPTPDQDYPAEWVYYGNPPYLDTLNQTNIITETVPELLIYASLVEASDYLKNGEDFQRHMDSYNRVLQTVDVEDKGRISDGGTVRGQSV